ncbi:MAG: hypothetical protein FWH47_03825 [Methanomassiliicoccaceae archaeon]|nr:hypothetical protein [Methanomassiliicoccaceae archaeon]
MRYNIIPLVLALILSLGVLAVLPCGAADGAEPTAVTDGTGEEFIFTEPTEHIVTMGYASTLTVAMMGEIGKIIAVDAYSTYEYTKDERLKGLDAKDMGSIYTASNNDLIVAQFVQWVEEGRMGLGDAIILTTYTNATTLRNELNKVGFDKVLVYLSVTSYDAVVDFVNTMSVIVTGEVSPVAKDMELVRATVAAMLDGVTDKAKGLGVWYSTSLGLQVNNTGSITVSLIEAAGGVNVAYDPSVSGARYGDASTIVQMVEKNPGVVIFLSDTYLIDHELGDFRASVLGGDRSIPVVIVKSNWNNYCPDAAEGLWAFACALYPSLFGGDPPHTGEASASNLLPYAAGGAVTVTAMLGAAYVLMRRI